MDGAFVKELGAATTATATVNTADGHPVPFEIPLKYFLSPKLGAINRYERRALS
jgi:hypothetical protein